jgi:antitoxin MazE
MSNKVKKWGNSLGVRIPQNIAREAQVDYDTPVDIRVDEGRIVITPLDRSTYTLEDLVGGITTDNLHGETRTGGRRGKEFW